MSIEWEEIIDETMPHFGTYRTKVPGGWLVRTSEFMRYELSCAQSEALVFVPDPEHKWDKPTDIVASREYGKWRIARCCNQELHYYFSPPFAPTCPTCKEVIKDE